MSKEQTEKTATIKKAWYKSPVLPWCIIAFFATLVTGMIIGWFAFANQHPDLGSVVKAEVTAQISQLKN